MRPPPAVDPRSLPGPQCRPRPRGCGRDPARPPGRTAPTPTPGARIRHVREGPYGLGGKLPPIVPDIMPREVLPEDLLLREYETTQPPENSPAP